MHIKESLRKGLIVLGIILYLNLLGIPLTAGANAVPIFLFVVGLMSLLLLRTRPHTQPRPIKEIVIDGLIIGLISGLGLIAVTYYFAGLQANGVRVNLVFAQVLPEHTGALTGLTKAEVLGGANAMPGLIRLAIQMTLAGLVGGLVSQVTGARISSRWKSEGNHNFRLWAILALPLVVYGSFLALKLESVQIAGSEENILGLVIIYIFMGVSLVAIRQEMPKPQKMIYTALLAIVMIIIPNQADLFQNAVLGYVFIFIIMGIGLNIVVGYAGLLDLGYVGFFAVGAYSFALLSAPKSWVVLNLAGLEPISFWTGLPIAIAIGVFAGIILGVPVLRMRGDYLAIVTLGFGEIIRLLLLNLRTYTGGPGGVLNIPPPIIAGIDLGNPRDIVYLGMAFTVIVTIITIRLRDSRLGRAWLAMREDEDVAEAMGINLVYTKLLAFAAGAAIAAVAGALYASRQVNIFPDNFALDVSINVLSLIIIGGIGSIDGVVLGAIALIGLPEILRSVDEYRIVAFGALLVIMMILRPEGMLPSEHTKREFHLEETSTD